MTFRALITFVVLLALAAAPARAQLFGVNEAMTNGFHSVAETERATTTLAPTREGFAPGETTWFVFRQSIAEGWHVYWRNPGDSGLPLELSWELPAGYVVGETHYPAPERIPVGEFINFGHHGEPVFLAPITAPETAAPGDGVPVKLIATWLVCEEVCVPETASFAMTLNVAAAPAVIQSERAFADAARAAAPATHDGAAMLYTGDGAPILVVDGKVSDGDAFFFPYKEGVIAPSVPQTFADIEGKLAFRLTAAEGAPAFVVGEDLRGLVATGGGSAQTYAAIVAKVSDAAAPPAIANALTPPAAAGSSLSSGGGDTNFLILALAAFFGGALLNVMPCVFPILFIKAAAFIETGSAETSSERASARTHAAAYAGGVVATFLALGAALLILRAGGAALGWGFHLQSPLVVALSAYVLFLVGLNLAGVFEIGTSMQNVGAGLAERKGLAGAFFTGVLAVFVAAPCIGPLLSAPMGAAVFLPPAVGMLIFLLMALGLAAPYVVLTTTPALARALPRPGPWMSVLKQGLAFPVFGAAAYFVWVLSEQTGGAGLARAFAGLVIVALAAWLFGLSQKSSGRPAYLPVLALGAFVLALAPLAGLRLSDGGSAAKGGYGAIAVAEWDEAAIEARRANGEGVFVDFTAAWCVTCQFNKATILSRRSVAERFTANNVTLMAADWTRRDPDVTRALQSFGASGVPLYVYYPPSGAPQVLSLPLTEGAITAAIESGVAQARK